MSRTPERDETIRVLWKDGCTAAMIAKRLGCTRNVVGGVVYRSGLSRNHAVRPALDDSRPKRARKKIDEAELRRLWATALPVAHVAEKLGTDGSTIYRAAKRLGLPKKADARGNLGRQVARARSSATERGRNMKPPAMKRQPLPEARPIPPDCAPVSLLAASFGQCRYPVAEWAGPDAPFYCGAPTMDDCGPYCRWHARIAHGGGTPAEKRAHQVEGRVTA